MLPDPPCIRGLVGCSDSTFVGSDSSEHASFVIPTRDRPSTTLGTPIGSLSGQQRTIPSQGQSSSRGRFDVPPRPTNGSIPSLPSVRLPSVSLPTVRLPSVSLPSVKLPSVSLPSVSLPSVSLPSFIRSSRPFGSLFGARPDLTAIYDISLRNLSSSALSDVLAHHGPTPFGASFDPLRSDQTCSVVAKTVQCQMSLGAGETRSFPIAYKVTNATFCRLSPVLQSVKIAIDKLMQNSAQPVRASVRCTVKNGDALDQSLIQKGSQTSTTSGPSAVAGNASSSREGLSQGSGALLGKMGGRTTSSAFGSGTNAAAMVSSLARMKGRAVGHTGFAESEQGLWINERALEEAKKSYGSQENATMPVTGIEQSYYAPKTDLGYILIPKNTLVSETGLASIFWLLFGSIILLAFIFRAGFSQREGLHS